MRYLFPLLIFLLIVNCSQGQIFKKYLIGASGCSAYFFCNPGNFNLDKSPDSSDVYTSECANEEVTFGVICVKLKDKISDMATSEYLSGWADLTINIHLIKSFLLDSILIS
ncbi:MAG: hypothetical protein WCR66_08160 [Bacteroidota bacterium]